MNRETEVRTLRVSVMMLVLVWLMGLCGSAAAAEDASL